MSAMIGVTEILFLAAFVASMLLLGFAFLGRPRRRAVSGTPTVPAVPARASEANPPVAAHEVVHIRKGSDLVEQLRTHAGEAERRGLRPFLEFGAVWCPPSRLFGEALEHPRMITAMAGVYLIRAESDDFSAAELERFGVRSVPVFYELDAEGEPTGRRIDGGAWGADTLDNMVRVMGPFFAG